MKRIKTPKTATKFVGYAYPSSPMATGLGHGKTGCWYVGIRREPKVSVTTEAIAFLTMAAAVEAGEFTANMRDLPWDRYSMQNQEHALPRSLEARELRIHAARDKRERDE